MNLEEIRRVTQQATPGPWEYIDAGIWAPGRVFLGGDAVIAPSVNERAGEFIALAREAIPWLLDRISHYETALREISEGRGPFSKDQLEFACDTIEAMKMLALDALVDSAELADCERTETAPTPRKPTRQADAR